VSGSGGDTGYDYQADATAFIAAYALTEQPLPWFSPDLDVPQIWNSETGGPGDDISVRTTNGRTIEIQAKHGLKRGPDYEETFKRLVDGLRKDPSLRAVLLIDRHASQVIREDLKIDLIRLSQGRIDELKSITSELLTTIGATCEERSLFARLRIVVVDLDDGNDGAAAAQALLSKVVAPDKCRSAFTLLGKRGHQLIKQRSADDALECARYLSVEVGLLPNSDAPSVSKLRFMDWSIAVNSDFFSPALQDRYPILKAWSTLLPLHADAESEPNAFSSLEAEIARYQEWTRLASFKRRENELSAEALVARHRLTAIVGGPGSGKTTLSKKLVWLTSRRKLAVRVRLPSVLALLAGGSGFDDALANLASNAFGGSAEERSGLLRNCHLLVLDGLDECDPYRVDVASQVCQWAAAHPEVHVCVLTRPIGHAPASLPGFIHAELLPLDEGDIREIVDTLLGPRLAEDTVRRKEAANFMQLVDTSRDRNVTSIAARNPLLLSFLVRLFLDGESLQGNRAALLERIVELIRKSPAQEKLQSSSPPPTSASAWTAAELVGWGTVEEPQRSAAKLCELIARQHEVAHGDLESAERVLDFWVRQGLVERITVGSRDAVVFVHLSLGEFLAGRYLAQQDAVWIREQVRLTRREAKWREPILLASGCGATKTIVSALLELDSPSDIESTEAVLAAAAISEAMDAGDVTEEARAVCLNLEARLTSDVPSLAIESAMALVRLAPLIRDLLTDISRPLRRHEYPWTRLTGFCLGLLGDADALSINEVVTWLSEVKGSADWPFQAAPWGANTYDLTKVAIPKALKRVAAELPAKDAETCVVKFLSRGDISVGVWEEVRKELDVDPYREWVLKGSALMGHSGELLKTMQMMQQSHAATHAVEISITEVLLELLEDQPEIKSVDPVETTFPNLGRLISSMKMGEMPAGDPTLIRRSDLPIMKEVLRGMIYGLPLDLTALRAEAQRMLLEFKTSDISLLTPAADVRDLDSIRIAGSKLDLPLLLEGLLHPSQLIGWNALRIVNACSLTAADLGKLTETFMKSRGLTLERCSLLISNRFGPDAFELLQRRWERGPKEACGGLFGFLIEAGHNDLQKNRAIQIALEGIRSSSPALAERAAIAVEKVDAESLRMYANAFAESFEEWKKRGSWCSLCQKAVHEYSCPDCHVVPPSPRKHLVPVLVKIQRLPFEVLVALAEDEDDGVAQASAEALVRWAAADDGIADKVFALISQGSLRLLNEFIRQSGQQLAQMGKRLEPLLSSPSASIRSRVIGTVGSGWMDRESARTTLLAATRDTSPMVRSAATKALRTGASNESEFFS
jgi:hypothetical protein